jgi:outer membrane protein assembly factor BamB
VVGGVGAAMLSHRSLGGFLLVPGLPLVLTAWTVGLLAARHQPPRTRRLVLVAAICLTWGAFTLVRTEGLAGDGKPVLRWRWQPTAEETYLAGMGSTGDATAEAPRQTVRLRPGDWPGFRGPDRDGTLRGVRLATDWNAAPPRPLWRRPVGPAWSSVAAVDGLLFTQEQVGQFEAVLCLDAANGRTVWSHRDEARHEDGQSGPGPRATPTFAGGRIYALGATGILNCLDAATGERQWSRDVAADAGVKPLPIWGFASSPLVVGDVVIVFAGGESEKTLLAYRTDSGKPVWSAPAGKISYSSPHLASFGGEDQVLFVSDAGLAAFDPTSGAVLWQHRTPAGNPGIPRAVQPRAVGPNQVLFDAGPDAGTGLVEVTRENGSWAVAERWLSRQLKPSFNDFVVHDSALYGFDGRVLTCIDLRTGRRRWKEGRYGSGQVLLLADQPLLLVAAESGEVALVAADPDRHTELGRFQAIEGKTWSHPAIADGRLYVRNAQEMACYELRLDGAAGQEGR